MLQMQWSAITLHSLRWHYPKQVMESSTHRGGTLSPAAPSSPSKSDQYTLYCSPGFIVIQAEQTDRVCGGLLQCPDII